MADRLYRVTQSFLMHGQVQQVGRLICIDDLRLVAPLFAAGQIEPLFETVGPKPRRGKNRMAKQAR